MTEKQLVRFCTFLVSFCTHTRPRARREKSGSYTPSGTYCAGVFLHILCACATHSRARRSCRTERISVVWMWAAAWASTGGYRATLRR